MRTRTLSGFVCSLAIVVAFGATVLSSAQERQMGGVGITVFADANFRGKSATFREDVSDLEPLGLNHRISSLRIGRGEQWEVCEHANYQGRCVEGRNFTGRCVTLVKSAPDLGVYNLRNRVASARPVFRQPR